MMRGYWLDPFGPESYVPSAGPTGGYEPFVPTTVVFEDTAPPTRAPTFATPFVEPPKTPTELAVTGGAPAPSETVEGALPVTEVPTETAPHPYEEEAPTEGEKAHPEVPATPVTTNGAVPAGEYVGGTELGPEAGFEVGEEEKSRWPIYVGVGAGVGLLALLALAAWGGSR